MPSRLHRTGSASSSTRGVALSSQLSLDVLLQRLVDTSAELAGARCAANTDLHVVGTIFDRAWVNGDMTQFQKACRPSAYRPAAERSST
jgi:hypothetical protein